MHACCCCALFYHQKVCLRRSQIGSKNRYFRAKREMYLLSLEGAKSCNLCLVVSMHRLKSISELGPPAFIIIVLISLKDDRALSMGYKQHHYWPS